MYDCCRKMAYELLEGLEKRDLALIESRLRPLRETLAVRHGLAAGAPPGGALLEHLDLLEGIAESVDAAVAAIRESSQPHLLRMLTAEALLRHLVAERGASFRGQLPVC